MSEKTERCESPEPVLRESSVPDPPVPEDGQMPEEPAQPTEPTPPPAVRRRTTTCED